MSRRLAHILVAAAFAALVAVAFFGERPMVVQWAGIGMGTLAVVLILWPQLVKQ